MKFEFSQSNEKAARAILKRYPYKQSAVMPFLTLAQKQCGGRLEEAAMRYVAKRLEMAEIRVYEVATFYDMYRTGPVGRCRLDFCNSISCWLRGSGELIKRAEELTGARMGGVSADEMFSLDEAPCLGACVAAPVVMINGERYAEDLTAKSLERLVKALREEPPAADGEMAKGGLEAGG